MSHWLYRGGRVVGARWFGVLVLCAAFWESLQAGVCAVTGGNQRVRCLQVCAACKGVLGEGTHHQLHAHMSVASRSERALLGPASISTLGPPCS